MKYVTPTQAMNQARPNRLPNLTSEDISYFEQQFEYICQDSFAFSTTDDEVKKVWRDLNESINVCWVEGRFELLGDNEIKELEPDNGVFIFGTFIADWKNENKFELDLLHEVEEI